MVVLHNHLTFIAYFISLQLNSMPTVVFPYLFVYLGGRT